MLTELEENVTAVFAEALALISFIIPAHNEEALISRSLAAIHASAAAVGEKYEIIVASDGCTDLTSDIACAHGASVVIVDHRQIAATRNAGARRATGDTLVFVDADTQVTEAALRAALRILRGGAVGGGACVRFDGGVPLYAHVLERLLRLVSPHIGLAAGCFLFCTRQAYLAAGGFNEAFYWGEEVAFTSRLKRQGPFVVTRECVITSGRKLRAHSALGLAVVGLRLALSGAKSLRQREGLEYWYGPRQPPLHPRIQP
jgi:glycosyltransferase involved in cell wall biosynthesis